MFRYCDLRAQKSSSDINLLFPGWEEGRERLAVLGAHDDDPLIGAGYAMAAAMSAGAPVYVVIFCNGECGYSTPEQKDSIVAVRRVENENALVRFGIPKENIIRFEYPDFSLGQYAAHKLQNGHEGTFLPMVDFIREHRITRALIPNGYREHHDHTAAYNIGMFDLIQAGDAVVSDRGTLQAVKSYLQYSVWSDFSPEDALVSGESNLTIRANRALVCDAAVEEKVCSAIAAYESQGCIIQNLMASRQERRTEAGYMELYIALDPRPKLDFAPYKKRIEACLA